MENKKLRGTHFVPYRDKNGKYFGIIDVKETDFAVLYPGINFVTERQYSWLILHPHRSANYGLQIKETE